MRLRKILRRRGAKNKRISNQHMKDYLSNERIKRVGENADTKTQQSGSDRDAR